MTGLAQPHEARSGADGNSSIKRGKLLPCGIGSRVVEQICGSQVVTL
jgi:hypothetical protein